MYFGSQLQVIGENGRFRLYAITLVPKVCSAVPKPSATGSQGNRGYISLMATSS